MPGSNPNHDLDHLPTQQHEAHESASGQPPGGSQTAGEELDYGPTLRGLRKGMQVFGQRRFTQTSKILLHPVKSMRSHSALVLLSLILTVALDACSTYDQGFNTLLSAAETTVDRNAIVGVWQRKQEVSLQQRDTILVRPDGTGLYRVYSQKLNQLIGEYHLKWDFHGDGRWTGRLQEDATMRLQFRMAGRNLLSSGTNASLQNWHVIFNRVE